MARETFYSSKRFLNKEGHHSDASIFCEIKFSDKENSWTDCSLKIKDCRDQIHLSVEIDHDDVENGNYENTIFKLDTLITELTNYKQACEKAHEESKRRAEVQKEKERQEEEKRKRERNGNSFGTSNDFTVQHISNPSGDPASRLGTVQTRVILDPNV